MFLKSSIGKIVSLTELNQGRYLNKKELLTVYLLVSSIIYSAEYITSTEDSAWVSAEWDSAGVIADSII